MGAVLVRIKFTLTTKSPVDDLKQGGSEGPANSIFIRFVLNAIRIFQKSIMKDIHVLKTER